VTGVPRLVAEQAVWVVDDRVSVLQVIVVGRAVDVHGAPIPGARIRCARPGAEVSAPGGEFLVVSGDPAIVLPSWATAPDALDVVVSAAGRQPSTITVPIPQHAMLPILLGDVVLTAQRVSVAGRTRTADAQRDPVANALVRFVADPAVAGLHPLGLRAPLVAALPAAGTSVRAATVAPLAPTTTVPAGARAGDRVVTLASSAGITGGTRLRFTPGRREHYAIVREVVGGLLVLESPLSASVPTGGPARAVDVAGTGPTAALARDAAPGDGLLLLNQDLDAEVVELVAPTGAHVAAVGARSDADGYFSLPGVRGVADIAVNAEAAALASTQGPLILRVDETRTNQVDIGVIP